MLNKGIHVSNKDLPPFERAQELSGTNLSSVIVRALRRFTELDEVRQRGLDKITVIVNRPGAPRKRFLGQRLVPWLQPMANARVTRILSKVKRIPCVL